LNFFPHNISKTDAAKITNLDIEIFPYESWKPFILGVKRAKVKGINHRNIAGMGLCTHVSAGFF